MKLRPNTDTVPASVNKYLLPDERQIVSLHQHPGVLVPPFAAAAGGLCAAILARRTFGDTGAPELVVFILVIFLFLKFILNVIRFFFQYIVITGGRFIQITGFFGRKVKDMPLTNLDEMTFQRSFAGRILGYGSLGIGPETDGQQVIDYIPYPEQVYLEIKGFLDRG